MGYPLTHYRKGKKLLFIASGVIEGEEENKKRFLKDLKKDSRLKSLDVSKDFFVALTEEPAKKNFEVFYNPAVIHVRPVIIDKKGFETWEVASFERSALVDMFRLAESDMEGELLQLRKVKLSDIFILHITPQLTSMQKKAIKLAYEFGYYSYPRKIVLKELAKGLGISFATYQEHLRKAEIKLLPLMIERLE